MRSSPSKSRLNPVRKSSRPKRGRSTERTRGQLSTIASSLFWTVLPAEEATRTWNCHAAGCSSVWEGSNRGRTNHRIQEAAESVARATSHSHPTLDFYRWTGHQRSNGHPPGNRSQLADPNIRRDRQCQLETIELASLARCSSSTASSRPMPNSPFLGYGTDWLAFGHFVIAIVFIGPLRDPVKTVWVVEFGMIACVLVVPFALVMGGVRGIPLG